MFCGNAFGSDTGSWPSEDLASIIESAFSVWPVIRTTGKCHKLQLVVTFTSQLSDIRSTHGEQCLQPYTSLHTFCTPGDKSYGECRSLQAVILTIIILSPDLHRYHAVVDEQMNC